MKLSEAGKIKGLSRNRADKGIIEDVTRYGTLKVKRNNRKAIEYLTEFWELDQ